MSPTQVMVGNRWNESIIDSLITDEYLFDKCGNRDFKLFFYVLLKVRKGNVSLKKEESANRWQEYIKEVTKEEMLNGKHLWG